MWSPAFKLVPIDTSNQRAKLTKRSVDAAGPAGRRYLIWDSQLPGFALRVEPTGRKTFILRYRPKRDGPSPKRFMTIGRYGAVTPEQARQRATEILGAVAAGHDPAAARDERRAALTVSEVVAEFLRSYVEPKRKANTAASYRQALYGYIVPAIGTRRLTDVTRHDILKLHLSMARIPAAANHAMAALSSLYSWAGRRGLVPEAFNPARRIEKYREQRRERYLTSEELARLGRALREAETVGIPWVFDDAKPNAKHAPKPENRITVISPYALAAIRLLLLSGCRLREILDLRWADVDFERAILVLPDSKTGRKTVFVGTPALKVLNDLPRTGTYVIAGTNPDKPLSGLKRPWMAIRRRAGLEGVRIHDLRHSYASVAAGGGLGLPIIGKLLGHSQLGTTARYAHLADDPVRRASAQVATQIAAALNGLPTRRPDGSLHSDRCSTDGYGDAGEQ